MRQKLLVHKWSARTQFIISEILGGAVGLELVNRQSRQDFRYVKLAMVANIQGANGSKILDQKRLGHEDQIQKSFSLSCKKCF